ncbi:MAG TPA: helix-turn-helix domain-containing protein [Microvirga sp.]|jgi:DNA-binding HxlR family transcriptional regulator|nr:helix-turn-helix domain-containing protein [Microvirga sp.]
MAAFDLLGRRWTMRILWELGRGPCTFRELQARCGQVSPATLNGRLKELRADHIVITEDKVGYRLTALGEELNTSLNPLRKWAQRWAERMAEEDGGQ